MSYMGAPMPGSHQSIGESKDVESDELETLAVKLGVKIPCDSEIIILGEEQLKYLNNPLDPEGHTLLMMFAEHRKTDIVGFLLRCSGLEVNAMDKLGKTAADIAWSRKDYVCLLRLLRSDSLFPNDIDEGEVDEAETGSKDLKDFLEERYNLHDHISLGNLDPVKEGTKCINSSLYLSIENVSALYWAAKHRQLEVFAFLWSMGASFKDKKEERKGLRKFDSWQEDELDYYLEEYFITHKNSHVFRLLSSTKVRGDCTDRQITTIKELYDRLNALRLVAPLMKVVEYEDVEVVFDFGSECVERICYSARGEIYGLTLPIKRRIYIGAKGCDSEKTSFTKIAGTLAHELCHMALSVLHGDRARPYKNEDAAKEEVFHRITLEIEGRKEKLDEVITRVFDYDKENWHAELIVRVPHILAMRGDSDGKKLLNEQVPQLLRYYVKEVVTACVNYSKDTFFKKPLCSIQLLQKYLGYIRYIDRENPPLKKSHVSFSASLIQFENMSILVTTNTKLTCMHVFFELKELYQFHLEKRCLFFELKCFKKNSEIILKAFTCKACENLVLVTNDKSLVLSDIALEFIDIELNEMKKVILIVRAECLQKGLLDKWKGKVLDYQWKDFSDSYKEVLMGKRVRFKGNTSSLRFLIDEERLSKIIQLKDVLQLMDGDDIVFDDGENLLSKGYNINNFIERSIVKTTVKRSLFHWSSGSCALFVTGLSATEPHTVGIMEEKMQWISDASDQVVEGKSIFLLKQDKDASKIFDNFLKKETNKFTEGLWLHFIKGEFFLKLSRVNDLLLRDHLKEDLFSEVQFIEISHHHKDRVILISDDPGTGKTTFLSDVIYKIKERQPRCWVGRINLNEFADDERNPLGLANIKENGDSNGVINFFCKMFRLETKLEVELFKRSLRYHKEKKVFIDGFDEISPLYKKNALKLLRVLKNETNLQLWICTRKHEEVDLELEMGIFSFRLEQLATKDQEKYLDGLWKQKLKIPDLEYSMEEGKKAIEYIHSKIEAILSEVSLDTERQHDSLVIKSLKKINEEKRKEELKMSFMDELSNLRSRIDALDLTPFARMLLENARASTKDHGNLFTGLPLHIFMLGEVAFNENLKIDICSDIYSLYLNFISGKIQIYFREKCGFTHITKAINDLQEEKKKEIIEFHEKLSQFALMPEKFPWDSIKCIKLTKVVHDIGIVTKLGDHIEFLHRTFAEFFFSSWMLDRIRQEEMEKELLERVLLDPGFHLVRRFMDCAFQREKNKASLSDNFIKEFDVKRVFVRYIRDITTEDVESCKNFWKDVIRSFEKLCYVKLDKEFISTLNHNFTQFDGKRLVTVLRLFDFCLGDEFYFKILYSFSDDILVRATFEVPIGYLSELLRIIKRILYCKVYSDIQYQSLSAISCISRNEMDESFDTAKHPHILEQTLQLLETRIINGMNLFHCAIKNSDSKVFPVVLTFTKGIVGDGMVNEYLTRRASDCTTILHLSAENGTHHVITLLNEIVLIMEESTLIELIKSVDDAGRNFLHIAAENCRGDELRLMLNHLCEIIGCELQKEMLIKKTERGGTVLTYALYHAFDIKDASLVIDVINISKETLSKEYFAELILTFDYRGQNIYHLSILTRRLDVIQIMQDSFKTYLTTERCKDLIFSKGKYSDTILHQALDTREVGIIKLVFEHANEILEREKMVEMIIHQDKMGFSLFHFSMSKSNSAILCYMWSFLKQILSKDDWIHLLMVCDDFKRTALHYAIMSRKGSFVEDMLNNCRQSLPEEKFIELFSITDEKGHNAYYLAVLIKNLEIMQIIHNYLKVLLTRERHKILLCSKTKHNHTILHLAVETGKVDVVKKVFQHTNEILEKENIIEMILQQDKSGYSLFHLAIIGLRALYSLPSNSFHYLCSLFKQILNQDERISLFMMADKEGNTALHHAVLSKDVSIIKDVLSVCREALPEDKFVEIICATNNEGHTIYHMVVITVNLYIIQTIQNYFKGVLSLERYKFFFCTKTKYNGNILHLALRTGKLFVIREVFEHANEVLEREDMLEMTLQQGTSAQSLLHSAIFSRDLAVISYLWSLFKHIMNEDNKINLLVMLDESNQSALHYAVLSKDVLIVKEVLNISREALPKEEITELICIVSRNNGTIYHTAVYIKNLEIMQIIHGYLKVFLSRERHGALLCLKNNYDDTIIHEAVYAGTKDEIKTVFEHASESLGRKKTAEIIVQHGRENHSLFHLSIARRNPDISICVWSFFNENSSLDERIDLLMNTDEDKLTILHLAVLYEDESVVKEVFKICAEALPHEKFVELISFTDNKGYTVCQLSECIGNQEIIKLVRMLLKEINTSE